MSIVIIWLITSLLFALGLLGTLLPAIPGLGLIIVGVLFYAIATKFIAISVTTTIVLCIIALTAFIASYFTGALGTKLGGGGRYAAFGTLIGALIGLITGPFGLIIGAVIGAFLGAFYESQSIEKSLRITVASLVGLLGGAIMQFLVAIGIIIAFLIAVLTV